VRSVKTQEKPRDFVPNKRLVDNRLKYQSKTWKIKTAKAMLVDFVPFTCLEELILFQQCGVESGEGNLCKLEEEQPGIYGLS